MRNISSIIGLVDVDVDMASEIMGRDQRVSDRTLDSCDRFFQSLPKYYRMILDVKDLSIVGRDTVSIDWVRGVNVATAEITGDRVHFYTELNGVIQDGNFAIGESCPKMIVRSLDEMFARVTEL